jgi:hypothetical protein
MSTLAVTNIQSQSSGTLPSFQDSGGVERGRMCVAFVNFNGTTSPGTIRASFNVSSVTKNGTGDYTVNFTNALADANFSVVISSSSTATAGYPSSYTASTTSSSVRLGIGKNVTSNDDCSVVTVAVFR